MVVKPIIDKYQILSKSEKKIADYFLENPNQAFGKSGEEISAITGTSPATLSRFVRKIGYKNLGDAKINLVKMLSTPQQTTIPEQMSLFVNEEDDFRKCGEKLLGQIQNVCASAQEVMDYQKLQLAVEKMKNARTIFLAGVGASNIVAQDLSIKLINIGCSVRYVLDPHVVGVREIDLHILCTDILRQHSVRYFHKRVQLGDHRFLKSFKNLHFSFHYFLLFLAPNSFWVSSNY